MNEWISQPLKFDTIFFLAWRPPFIRTSFRCEKSLSDSVDTNHILHLMVYNETRAHVLNMQIFTICLVVAAGRDEMAWKTWKEHFAEHILFDETSHRSHSNDADAKRACGGPTTTRENNNNLGSFQWKYIMTTSSRNLSYMLASWRIFSEFDGSNDLVAMPRGKAQLNKNIKTESRSHHCE